MSSQQLPLQTFPPSPSQMIPAMTLSQEREDKRMKALREAEALFHREQEKGKHHPITILELPRRKKRDIGEKMKFMLKRLILVYDFQLEKSSVIFRAVYF